MKDEPPPSKPPRVEKRRASRQHAAVPVLVSGLLGRKTRFDERTNTLNVSDYGACLRLQTHPPVGTAVMVENLTTGERVLFRVARVNDDVRGGYQVGVHAPESAPHFWRLNWNLDF